jgi:hypothetical protein
MMKKEWEQLALQLNSIGSANKNGADWKKSWQDLRRGTKSKAAEMKNHAEGTGSDPSSASLNPIQEKVASLLENTVIYGHNTVDESACDFTDDDDTDTKQPMIKEIPPMQKFLRLFLTQMLYRKMLLPIRE